MTMKSSKLRLCLTFAITVWAGVAMAPRSVVAIEINLLPNGGLGEGSGKYPAYWRERFEQFESAPDATELGWNRESDQPDLEVRNVIAAAAGFQELVQLRAPGWYRFSAEIETRAVGDAGAGAQVGLGQFSIFTIATPGVRSTSGWNRVEFYLHANQQSRETMVFCRLGARGSPSAGDARFRDFRLVRIYGAPPPDVAHYDLDALAPATMVDTPWSVAATFAVLAIVTIIGWRSLSPKNPA
jgi:hypothetical protein